MAEANKPFATVSDLESRWRTLSPDEAEIAEALLSDASAILAGLGLSGSNGDLLRIVTCNMVRRSMESHGDAFGVGMQSDGASVWSPSLPAGDLYPYDREIRMLGGSDRVGLMSMIG